MEGKTNLSEDAMAPKAREYASLPSWKTRVSSEQLAGKRKGEPRPVSPLRESHSR